ncbi:MAG: hypothetical protein OHK0053_24800 [Microscillaceae bacterium]
MPHPDTKVNLTELLQYSRTFAQRLTDYYFIDHGFIAGKDLLNFCDIKQVNLFVVKHLFERWQEETLRLKSPYFDFEHPQVKQALQQFMNVLSQHIRVSKESFYPLLAEAVREALLLVVDYEAFFRAEVQKNFYQPYEAQRFKDTARYLNHHRKIWLSFCQKLSPHAEISLPQLTEALEMALLEGKNGPEPIDWVLQSFSDIYALDISRLLGQEAGDKHPEATVLMTEMATVLENKPSQTPSPASKLVPPSEESKADESRTLNQAFKNQDGSLSIAERFQQAKIASLRTAISLNQKFLFINKLFEGDSFAFNETIDRLDKYTLYEDARQWLQKDILPRYQWDLEQEEAQMFMEMLERKFY